MVLANDPAVVSPAVDPVEPDPARPKAGVSVRKRAANRANASKSTGPRTEEGKARSKLNAVTHGLTASLDVIALPGEDDEEFEAFARALVADLRPRGAMQYALVSRIAVLNWRLRRVAWAEQAMWKREDVDRARHFAVGRQVREQFGYPLMPGQSDQPPAPHSGPEFVAAQFERKGTSPLERLGIYEQRLDRALHAALRQLERLQKLRGERDEATAESADDEQTAESGPGAAPRNSCQNEATVCTPAHPDAPWRTRAHHQDTPGAQQSGAPDPVAERSPGTKSGAALRSASGVEGGHGEHR